MADETQELEQFTASITLRQLGSAPKPRVLTLGVEPCILIEPIESEEHGIIFALDSTGVDKENVIAILEAMANTLKETELKRVEEG